MDMYVYNLGCLYSRILYDYFEMFLVLVNKNVLIRFIVYCIR